jgi:hypothetical protein
MYIIYIIGNQCRVHHYHKEFQNYMYFVGVEVVILGFKSTAVGPKY